MRNQKHSTAGFTLIELSIVVVIIGLLAAISIPNFMRFTERAKEASVRENMHVIQSGVEVFAVDNLGTYPQPVDQPALQALLPAGNFPPNPFTLAATSVSWNIDPANPGEIGLFNLAGGGYMLKGFGKNTMLTPPLQVGN